MFRMELGLHGMKLMMIKMANSMMMIVSSALLNLIWKRIRKNQKIQNLILRKRMTQTIPKKEARSSVRKASLGSNSSKRQRGKTERRSRGSRRRRNSERK